MGSVTMFMDARMCDTIVSDSGAGAAISETRAQPYISVSSSSDSMHFVTHATIQSCAAGARMTSEVDTSERRNADGKFPCTKKCGGAYMRKRVRDKHSEECEGPKACLVPTCSYMNTEGSNIIGCVF